MIKVENRIIFVALHKRADQWLKDNFDSFTRTFQEIAESGNRVFERYTCTKKNPWNPEYPFVFGVLIVYSFNPSDPDFFTYEHSTTIGRDLRNHNTISVKKPELPFTFK